MKNGPIAPRNILEPDGNFTIWRYMDYYKLIDLFKNKYLPFVSPKLFTDNLEGAYTESNLNIFRHAILNGDASTAEIQFHNLHHLHEDAHGFSKSIYVTCWHLAETETMSMWNCYSKLEKGIAITSTYKKLHSILDSRFLIGKVKYYCDDEELPPNAIHRHFYKSKPYENESEVRGLYYASLAENCEFAIENNILKLPIDPTTLIESVIISPNADEQFVVEVHEILAPYNINVYQSKFGNLAKPKKLKNLLINMYEEL
jgi:hypothetical protein